MQAAAAGAILMTLAPGRSVATTVLPMTLQTKVNRADRIIEGTVASVECFESPETGVIQTRVSLAQVDVLLGGPVAEGKFELVVPGGVVGRRRWAVAGAPRLEVGRRYALFLRDAFRIHPVVGIAQGAFEMTAEPGGRVIVRDAFGRDVVAIGANGFVRTRSTRGAVASARCVPGVTSGAVVRVVPRAARASAGALMREDFVRMIRSAVDRRVPEKRAGQAATSPDSVVARPTPLKITAGARGTPRGVSVRRSRVAAERGGGPR